MNKIFLFGAGIWLGQTIESFMILTKMVKISKFELIYNIIITLFFTGLYWFSEYIIKDITKKRGKK